MNRELFFDRIRQSLFKGKLTASQVAGIETILDAVKGWPTRWVAYGLATAFHEVGGTMQPVREGFKLSDAAARAYVKRHYWTMRDGKPGYGRPAGPWGHVYYGRGFVQLTWLANYERASKVIGFDVVSNPDRVMEPAIAALILRDGMERGWFTRRKLADYLSDTKTDYRNARRIINGIDKADLIAGYALAFEAALRAAGYGASQAKPAPLPKPAAPSDPTIAEALLPPDGLPGTLPTGGSPLSPQRPPVGFWQRFRNALKGA